MRPVTPTRHAAERNGQLILAAAAIVKNEAAYIEEWIAYHNVVGVEHFLIYDNGSTDGLHELLTPYINHGLVTLFVWPLAYGQASAYRHAAYFFGESTRWLAFIDIDEFIVPRCDPDLPTLLQRVDPEQLVMPWRKFGFSGHHSRPPGLVMENYTMAQDLPDEGLAFIAAKAIVKPSALTGVAIHLHRTRSGKFVDAGGFEVETNTKQVMRPSYEVLQVNHYYTKSEQEFAVKLARGGGSGTPPMDFYGIAEEVGYSTPDTAIGHFIEPTKRRLADLRSLSPKPFRYGSQLDVGPMRYDPFKSHARRAIANHLHGVEKPANSSPAVDDVGHRARSCVVRVPAEVHLADRGRFLDSVHVHDFVRRLGASWISRHCSDVPDGMPTAFAADDPALHRHLAVVIAVDATAATRVTFSARGPESHEALTTELAEQGTYLCIAQITGWAPIRADGVDVAVDSGSPYLIRELGVLSYG